MLSRVAGADPDDIDTRSHLGQCLLRKKKPEGASVAGESVRGKPKHDYGHSRWPSAETQAVLGDPDAAIATWQRVLEDHLMPAPACNWLNCICKAPDRPGYD